MAFSNGDIVTMTLTAGLGVSGIFGPLAQGQPPHFGVVADANEGDPDVLWEDGRLEANVPGVSLDLVGAPDAGAVTALQGFVVKTDPSTAAQQESPEYQGTVVTLYTRDNNGGGSPTETLCLMRTATGTYREVLASTLVAIAGR